MKVNSEKVLRKVERLITVRIPGEVLELFRYNLANCKISSFDLHEMSSTLQEFLYSFAEGKHFRHYSIDGKEISLYSECLFIDSHTPKKCKIRVFSLENGPRCRMWTTQVHDLNLLLPFTQDLTFIQNDVVTDFENLDPMKDVVAIGKKSLDDVRVVIHYVP